MRTISKRRVVSVTWGSDLIAGPVNRVIATMQNGVEVLRFGGLQTGSRPWPFQMFGQLYHCLQTGQTYDPIKVEPRTSSSMPNAVTNALTGTPHRDYGYPNPPKYQPAPTNPTNLCASVRPSSAPTSGSRRL